jgi:23S rRNA pseudouridine2605 synthase
LLERLHKTIARSGLASRRRAEQLIVEGRVRVGGEVVTQLGAKVDPVRDEIRVDGVRVHPDRPRRYILLNKPTGYLTTRSDPRHRPTVMELLPVALRTLFPVGRLDRSASGLLLLTDDGDFAQRVAHPRYGVTKTYAVTVRGMPSERTLGKARSGIRVDGDWLKVVSVRVLSKGDARRRQASEASETTRLQVILNEGRYREIGRLFKGLGHPVIRLHRERVGFLSDRGLPLGTFRSLHPDEVSRLLEVSKVGASRARAAENDRSSTKKRREAGEKTSQPPRAERARRESAANSASRGGGAPRH